MTKRDPGVFDANPSLYDRVRPGYPPALFSTILAWTGLEKQSRLLEIGCGTGKATIWFAGHGYIITAVEKGSRLAEYAKHAFSPFPNVSIVNMSFEDYQGAAASYDLVYSGTAFHWLDKSVAYGKAAELLKPGGHLALFWIDTVVTGATKRQSEVIQEAYWKHLPEWAKSYDREGSVDRTMARENDIIGSGLFQNVRRQNFDFSLDYTSSDYIDLLSTFSDHGALDDKTMKNLFHDIKALVDKRLGGRLTRECRASLFVAGRR